MKAGSKEPRPTMPGGEEGAVIVLFRRYGLLPLDDCLHALQPSIPHLTRSALHRCLQRHGISRLPEMDGSKPKRQRFKQSIPCQYRRSADRRRVLLHYSLIV